ncbi:MAG: Holliday junction branch migration protein RuvA [Firmicutes bacterium]|nr:Holliday junction branch migration protein RuvA [Bacillota bacterium]
MMIAFLRGRLHAVRPDSLILDVNGVGYHVYTSSRTLAQLPTLGEEIEMHTYLHVREGSIQLFGFREAAQLEFFLLLIEVSGVGPKAALSILSAASVADLSQAVLREDVSWLTKLPGVGKKTAQRLLVELKDKIGRSNLADLANGWAETGGWRTEPLTEGADVYAEASQALLALGYQPHEIRGCLEQIRSISGEDVNLQRIIRLALQYLAKG